MAQLPVVYLLPGLLCDAAVWEPQRVALSPFMEVRIPDFRGLNSFREMALQVLRDAPRRFSVVGHSMGGRVALELMALAPERIQAFVVMDLGAHPVQPGEEAERMLLVREAEALGMEALAAAWIPPMVAPSRRGDSELLGRIRAMVLRQTPADYRAHIEAALGREDQSRYLPGIEQRVLVICGEEDEWSPVAQHREIVAALPRGELAIVPGAGHMVTLERPEQVNRLLLDWFAAEPGLPDRIPRAGEGLRGR